MVLFWIGLAIGFVGGFLFGFLIAGLLCSGKKGKKG